jgi:hypothetical protein
MGELFGTALATRRLVLSFAPLCAGVWLLAFVSFPNPFSAFQIDSSRMPCGILSVMIHPHCAHQYAIGHPRSRESGKVVKAAVVTVTLLATSITSNNGGRW